MGVMNIAEIMDRSVGILKKNLKTIILYNLGYGAIGFVGFFILVMGIIVIGALGTTFMGSWGAAIPIGLVILLMSTYFASFAVGVTKIASQEFVGEKIYAFEAIKISFKHIFKVLGLVLCMALAMIPVLIVFGLGFYMLFRDFESRVIIGGIYSNLGVGMWIISGLIFLLLIFVSTIFMTLFSLALPAMIVEKIGVIKSIKRSFRLVRVNLWRIVGFVTLMGLTVYALRVSVTSFIFWVLGIIALILKLFSVSPDYLSILYFISTMMRTPMEILAFFIFTPISTIMITLLYFNQRFKHEGFDLVLKLKNIEKTQERNLS